MSPPFTAAASSILAALLAISSPALAQAQGAQPAGPSDSTEEEEGYVPEDEAAVEEESTVPTRSAPSAASLAANRRVQDPNQSLRIVTEVVLSGFLIPIGYLAGTIVGVLIASPFAYSNSSVLSIGGLIGGAAGLLFSFPLSVWLVGSLWQAKGRFGPTLVGGLIGGAVFVGLALISLTAYNYGLAPLAMLGALAPLIGSIVGYETSHAKALQSAVPVARPLWFKGGGGGVALAWAI